MSERTFPEVPERLSFTIAFSSFMFLVLIYMSTQSSAIDPFMFYLIMGIYLLVLGLGTTEWRKMNKVLGLSTPYPLDNILMPLIGLGFAGVFHALVISRSLAIFQGTWLVNTVITPLYIPLRLPQFSVALGIQGLGSAIFYTAVAVFEEAYVLLIFKNMTNYLTKKNVRLSIAAIVSLLISRLIWAFQHYLSWDEFGLASILFAISFGLLFYAPYFIKDISGILSPKKPIKWTGIIILSAITFHLGYDFYLTEGMFLPEKQFLILHSIFIVVGFVGIWLIRRFSDSGIVNFTYE